MMDDPAVLSIVIGVAVIGLIGGLGLVMAKSSGSAAEDRLAGLTGEHRAQKAKKQDLSSTILARPAAIDLGRPSFWQRMIPNAENLNLLYEQADVSFSFNRFMIIVAGMAVAGAVFALVFQLPTFAVPVTALIWGMLPFFWLMRRRRKRISWKRRRTRRRLST
jgi:Flp pilus assembly protein TadB